MKKNKKNYPPSISHFYPMLIVMICLFMSIGYATINSTTLTIDGDILAKKLDGVFVTDIRYKDSVSTVSDNSSIKIISETVLNPHITLSSSDSASFIRYTITLFNSNNYDCQFVGAIFDADFHDNYNIIFELSDNLKEGIWLSSKSYITFDITFKYKNGVVPNENFNTLNSYINFKFNSIAMLQPTYDDDATAFRSKTYKEKIKIITFEEEINVPEDTIDSWDIGIAQNGNVIAYVTANEDDSTYYDLYIQSDSQLYANKDMSYWFYNFQNVDSINGLELLDTTLTTNMNSMFYKTGYLSTALTLDVSNLETSNVTNMSYMFYQTGYNNPTFSLDVSNFDTNKVTNMAYMFNETGYLSTVLTLDVSNFNTDKVTNMRYMFYKTGWNNPTFTLDVSNFNTNNVTNMRYMFYNTGYNSTVLTLDVSNFNMNKVINMSYMFYQTGYNNTTFTLDVSNFDTSNATNMSYMFYQTGYLSTVLTLDVSNFDTSNVTNMSYMFFQTGHASTEFTLDVSKFDTSNVTDMSYMFYQIGGNSTKLNTSITIKNHNTTLYSRMFYGAATQTGSKITVNYTSETSELVDKMIATKSDISNVVKGVQVD